MNISANRLRGRRIPRSPRSWRQRATTASAVSSIAVVVALAIVYGAVLSASRASTGLILAGFEARSYAPGQVALLAIGGGQTNSVTLQIFQAGASGTPGPAAAPGWDEKTFGKPVTEPQRVSRPAGTRQWLVHVRLGSSWPSGDYVARLTWPGHTDYAPFVLRPARLGTAPVLVVEPTNTWHAYDAVDGDSWYLDPSVHTIDLTHPFADSRVNGGAVPAGLPEQFQRFDLGLLRWYWRSGYRADFISDDDLERIANAGQLRRYRLIVFGGHEEYVTSHTFDLITAYRNAGGNLAFLAANSFFYRVRVSGNTMTGRTRWRDLGRPEAALLGAQYAGWDEGHYPNRPYRITNTAAAPWLFKGTGLHDGSSVGNYGIEVDEPNSSSPPHTHVLAVIPNELGPGKPAEMTIYTRGRSTVFDAGAINFEASAHWPALSRFFSNLWSHLSGETSNR
ncbi:MAG TPA: N,N-dimethylformamidase beta subunit family domain-containing protein [Gaiellaceae bacterium]|nr:N,N-dimethylformamidase beta subunit family domain-containing protein [Gaiellaceae bacterium]